jgi:hypothetical protein
MPGTASIFKGEQGFGEILIHGNHADAMAFLERWLVYNHITVGITAVRASLGRKSDAGRTIELEPPLPGNAVGIAVVTALARDMHQQGGLDRVDVIDTAAQKVLLTSPAPTGNPPKAVDLDELGAGLRKPTIEDTGEVW